MDNFKKIIETDSGLYTFRFSKVMTALHLKYFVTVDLDGKDISFDIIRTVNGWNIVPPAPEWIIEVEGKISIAVDAHSQG